MTGIQHSPIQVIPVIQQRPLVPPDGAGFDLVQQNLPEGQTGRNIMNVEETRQSTVLVQPITDTSRDRLAVIVMLRVAEKYLDFLKVICKRRLRCFRSAEPMPEHSDEFTGEIADEALLPIRNRFFPTIPAQRLLFKLEVTAPRFHNYREEASRQSSRLRVPRNFTNVI